MQEEQLFEEILRRSKLEEMATVCKKTDGFGIVIEVFSEDHGILGDKTDPAHAHLKTASDDYLGRFAITLQPPRSKEYVFDLDDDHRIPTRYKDIIVEWGNSRNEDGILRWPLLKSVWRALHPDSD